MGSPTEDEMHFFDAMWERNRSDPVVWIASSESLFRSFDILSASATEEVTHLRNDPTAVPRQPQVGKVALMCGGFAIEMALKALIFARASGAECDGVFTHDLPRLAEKAQLELSEQETDSLSRLTVFITWGGRYPTPKEREHFRPYTFLNGGWGLQTIYAIPTDFDATKAIYGRIKTILQTVAPWWAWSDAPIERRS
jgi:hypothetical protein